MTGTDPHRARRPHRAGALRRLAARAVLLAGVGLGALGWVPAPARATEPGLSAGVGAGEMSAVLARFEAMRNRRQADRQPDLIRLTFSEDLSHFDADVKDAHGRLDFGTGPGRQSWSMVSSTWSRGETSQDRHTFAATGAHRRIGQDLFGGLMIQMDHALRDRRPATSSGDGWMFGPYLTGRMLRNEIAWSMQALTGQGRVSAAPQGRMRLRARSTRQMLRGRLEGSVGMGRLTLVPSLRALHVQGSLPRQRLGAGVVMPGQRISLSQVTAGLDFNRTVPLPTIGPLTLEGGLSVSAQRSEGTGLAARILPRSDGYSSRVEIGLDYHDDQFGRLRTAMGIDGSEGAPLETVGLSLSWEHRM